MIRFYGFEPETEIKIEYSGLRAGERLDERLWSVDEEPRETEYSRILRVDKKTPCCIDLPKLMDEIKPICRFDPQQASLYRDNDLLRAVLRSAIPAMNQVHAIA